MKISYRPTQSANRQEILMDRQTDKVIIIGSPMTSPDRAHMTVTLELHKILSVMY